MNLIYAQVVERYSADGALMGKVSHWGVIRAVPLHLVPEAQPGDTVLVCDGVAIGKVNDEVVAQASSPASMPGVPLGRTNYPGSETLPEPAGEDACATLKGVTHVSGSSR
jgi:hydrogenase maturation factor